MAKVTVAQVGSVAREINASTVKEALEEFGAEGSYQVKIDGASATMESTLRDGQFLSIGEKVKGGL